MFGRNISKAKRSLEICRNALLPCLRIVNASIACCRRNVSISVFNMRVEYCALLILLKTCSFLKNPTVFKAVDNQSLLKNYIIYV